MEQNKTFSPAVEQSCPLLHYVLYRVPNNFVIVSGSFLESMHRATVVEQKCDVNFLLTTTVCNYADDGPCSNLGNSLPCRSVIIAYCLNNVVQVQAAAGALIGGANLFVFGTVYSFFVFFGRDDEWDWTTF